MLNFLHPTAFLALLGLLIPLAIHLWERRQGRRVLVGSLRLLEEADEQRINHLQLTDLWRLLLRALILVLFVFLLAGPVWKAQPEEDAPKHWVLLTPGLAVEGQLLAHLDSLRATDQPVRMLAPGFPEWTMEQEGHEIPLSENYWSLLRELCRQPAAPDTVTIFGDPLLRYFRGERPGLSLVVRWQSLPERAAIPFLVNAWKNADQLEVLMGLSGAEGTAFRRSTVPAKAGEHPLPEPFPPLMVEEGGSPQDWEVRLENGKKLITVKDIPKRLIHLVVGQRQEEEGRYLQAALRAVAAFTGLEVDIQPGSAETVDEVEVGDSEWLFWLPEQPLPPALAEVWAQAVVEYRPSSHYQERNLRREAGRVILQRKLAPEGPDLRIDERLPAELIDLLFAGERQYAADYDQRFLADEQLAPVYTAGRVERASSETALHGPLWLLLLVLFLVERLLAAGPEWRKRSQ